LWFQKIFIPPPQRVTGKLDGEEGLKGKIFEAESIRLNWNFQRGWGSNQKPSVGGVWIFLGATQSSERIGRKNGS